MTRRRRIAITGLAGAGKTVFLTTLINHLKHHDASAFHLFKEKRPVAVKQLAELDVGDGLPKFNHYSHARAMQTGHWPKKTVDVSEYACRFGTTHHWVDHRVEFLDWPGERVADVIMYSRDYAEWSDRLLEYWEGAGPSYRRHVDPYLTAVRSQPLAEESLLADYRLAMARLILDYCPLISPSCFLVGRDGVRLAGATRTTWPGGVFRA